ncbi:hypothetical protein [Novosphingobium sp. PhB55]|uniref:hypothetical protein n=1 Tax=Novosphingobium sp. PhB55 TaxID=2485106 RepID=UPI0014170AEA|nr:hypothetical protein [Novosphingobium sp. PhB55]
MGEGKADGFGQRFDECAALRDPRIDHEAALERFHAVHRAGPHFRKLELGAAVCEAARYLAIGLDRGSPGPANAGLIGDIGEARAQGRMTDGRRDIGKHFALIAAEIMRQGRPARLALPLQAEGIALGFDAQVQADEGRDQAIDAFCDRVPGVLSFLDLAPEEIDERMAIESAQASRERVEIDRSEIFARDRVEKRLLSDDIICHWFVVHL